jgi:hypothetical protein
MQLHHVDPVGVLEHPEGYVTLPRRHPSLVRIAAALLLGAFLAVSTTTTVYSLGAYCLTTYANVPFIPPR